MLIYFSAKANWGLDDFDHDMPHVSQAVFCLDMIESRQIDSFGGLIFHPSINQSEDWPINRVYAENFTAPSQNRARNLFFRD